MKELLVTAKPAGKVPLKRLDAICGSSRHATGVSLGCLPPALPQAQRATSAVAHHQRCSSTPGSPAPHLQVCQVEEGGPHRPVVRHVARQLVLVHVQLQQLGEAAGLAPLGWQRAVQLRRARWPGSAAEAGWLARGAGLWEQRRVATSRPAPTMRGACAGPLPTPPASISRGLRK